MIRSLIEAPLDLGDIQPHAGFSLVPWSPSIMRDHGKVKYESFRNEMDSSVFPCLGQRDGCIRLMKDLAARSDFSPEATWLAVGVIGSGGKSVPVGTIQGLKLERTKEFEGAIEVFPQGSIQNIGLIPSVRGQGLGRVLLTHALAGFQQIGCKSVSLEVTSHNTAATRMYLSMGFKVSQIAYKVSEVPVT